MTSQPHEQRFEHSRKVFQLLSDNSLVVNKLKFVLGHLGVSQLEFLDHNYGTVELVYNGFGYNVNSLTTTQLVYNRQGITFRLVPAKYLFFVCISVRL